MLKLFINSLSTTIIGIVNNYLGLFTLPIIYVYTI